MSRLPLLATGKLGADYELLFAYWEIAKEEGKGREKDVVLRSEDMDMLESLSKQRGGRIRLDDAISALTPSILGRIDAQLAQRAYRKVHQIDVSQEFAAAALAKVIALWTVEALETMGKVRV